MNNSVGLRPRGNHGSIEPSHQLATVCSPEGERIHRELIFMFITLLPHPYVFGK